MKTSKLKIEGMGCQHCVMTVRQALGAVPGVSSVKVEAGGASVDFDEAKVTVEDLVVAVIKAGYKASA